MKKIFAIALALVMVLSMTSAFAAVGGVQCYNPTYDCPTVGCGVAKAYVVQFAKNNTIDKYEETACAAVVAEEDVYFGVKVVFDADVNQQWFEDANTKLEIKVTNGAFATVDELLSGLLPAGTTASDVSGKTFWFDFGKIELVEDWSMACVEEVQAVNTKIKVCADVNYKHNGIGTWDYTNFDAEVASGTDAKGYDYKIDLKKSGKTLELYVIGGTVEYAVFGGNVYYNDNGTIMVWKNATLTYDAATKTWTVKGSQPVAAGLACDDIEDYLALIGVKLGDCVTAGTVKNIFGWDDKDLAKDCATWNKNAVAIVDANCVLSIPKTGDVSVVAYAVMAVVAAAGTMLKK